MGVLCALLFVDVLVAAAAEDAGKLSAKCAVGNQKACEILRTVVWKLTDQPLLAKIAEETRDPNVRKDVFNRLSDQALLAKIAVEAEDSDVRHFAFNKLTDQSLLAKLAVDDKHVYAFDLQKAAIGKLDQSALWEVAVTSKYGYVRKAAVERLNDQNMLEQIAVRDKDVDVRKTAVGKLTDQKILAMLAVEGKNSDVRIAVLGKLSDQALLTKIAAEDADTNIRKAAVGKLIDQTLLAKIAVEDKDRAVRFTAIVAMDGSNPALTKMAGLGRSLTEDVIQSIARINLAIHERCIRKRFPRIELDVSVSNVSVWYGQRFPYGDVSVPGESISVVVSQAGKTLAKKNYSSFPVSWTQRRYMERSCS